MRVVIVGAGIGGLTAAIALRRSGIDAVVLERAPELREVGAGISLWPNAINAFRRLGVGEAVEAAGTPVGDTMIGDWRGRSLHRSSSELVEIRFGAPLVMIQRATLHSVLRESLGEEFLRLGTPCLSFEQDADGVRLQLADGVEQCDVAIGADGLHSVMRAGTVGDGAPRHSGLRAWRAVASVDGGLAAQVAAGEYWGHGSLFGVQSLGRDEFYWYAASAGSGSEGEGEAETARTDLLRLFGSWADPVPALIEATDGPILCNDLYDRRVPDSLAFGRVALVGDAAHPMVPSLGQGACQAVADGEAVADALAQAPDPASGLRLYSDRRRPVAALAVTQSRRMSKVAHLRSPMMAALRNTLLKRTSQESSLTRLSPIIEGDHRVDAAARLRQ
jgi:2-polyprenyl-6-methoxyphenol hydroxylase-like FAD-dependent oxidoreductase